MQKNNNLDIINRAISKTKLYALSTCEAYFNFKYIKKIKPTNNVSIIKLIQGVCVHQITEYIDKKEDYNINCMLDEEIENRIKNGTLKKDEYIQELELVLKKLYIFEDLYKNQVLDKLSKYNIEKKFIENTQYIQLQVGNQEVVFSGILDRIFFIKREDFINNIDPKLMLEEDIKKQLNKLKKEQLQNKCNEYSKEYDSKDIKEKLIEKIYKFELEKENKILEQNNNEKINLLSDMLNNVGYTNNNDYIPVIVELKTSNRKKTISEIQGLSDIKLYSYLFYKKTGKIPIFQIIQMNVTDSLNSNIQYFNIITDIEEIKNVRNELYRSLVSIRDTKYFNKNTSSWKCSENQCEYYDICMKNKINIIEV